jgi:hypothetical protein
VQRNDKAARVVHIFESYGWRDSADVAERLKNSLTEHGYEVWIDREHLRSDDKDFSLALETAISGSEVVVALLSPHSVRGMANETQRSSICYNELRYAEELTRPIVPVRVLKFDGPPPFLLIKYRRVDWLHWGDPAAYRKGLREIIKAIDRAIDGDPLYDQDIRFLEEKFENELHTAVDSFTGRGWFFDRVQRWIAGQKRCLLVEGVTGSGKTALAAELVRRNPGGRVLAYHFCTHQNQFTLDPTIFVKSIAGMLATAVDAYADQLWNAALANWFQADPHTMLSGGVLAPLRRIPMEGTFYIVVDALDEAAAVSGPVTIPMLLANALPEFPEWLRLMATSRPHPTVHPMFGAADTCVLDHDNAQHLGDVHAFIEGRLAPVQTLIEPAQREVIAAQISTRATGNFQYAETVLDALADGEISVGKLHKLPEGLEALYFKMATRRFPEPSDYRHARQALSLLLAAREPLTLALLASLTGLDRDHDLQPALERISCFTISADNTWRIAHKSIADWLIGDHAGRFTVDLTGARERLLDHCVGWATHHEAYALKHVVAHLLEANKVADAVTVVGRGLFGQRGEPRLDAEDSRSLTDALIAAEDVDGIVALAKTTNVSQRDGVAAALQAAPPDKLAFIDRTVGALLAVSA